MKKRDRVCAIMLVASFIFLVGCKKKKEERTRVVQESDPYYSCDEIRLDFQFPSSDGKELKRRSFGLTRIFSNCVLVSISEEYVMTDEFAKKWNDFSEHFEAFSEDEIKRIQEERESYSRKGVAVFNLDGKMENFTETSNYSEIECMIEDPSGNPKVLISEYTGNGYIANLYSVSSEGELVNAVTLSRDVTSIGDAVFLKNGNLLCSDVSSVILFSPEGKLLNEESLLVPIDRIFQIDGKYYAYISIEDVYDDTNPPTSYMYEIDPNSGKKVGEKIDVTGKMHGSKLIQGREGLYGLQGNGIQKYDLLTGKEPQEILNWSDTDCNHYDASSEGPSFYIASENDIYLSRLTYDGVPMEYVNTPVYVCLLHLHRVEKNPHAGKNILYLAYIGDLKKDFMGYLNEYNLNSGEKTRIVLQDYSGDSSLYSSLYSRISSSTEEQARIADQVYLDILSGDGPDILLNFGAFSQFNTDRALVNLNPLIDGERSLDRALLFDNILRAYERDGKLYQIPLSFSVTGMVANKDFVGDRTGWTYEETKSIAQSLPANVNLFGNVSQSDLLESLMKGSTSHFLDYNNRKVKFDDPEFKEILELVKNNGIPKTNAEIEKERQANWETVLPDNQRFDAGMIVAMNKTIHSLSAFGNISTWCNGNVCFIGNPSMSGSGAKADNAYSLAISQSSQFKEEAWDFIRNLFEDDIQLSCAKSANNFPVNRQAFNSLMDMSFEENRIGWERAETESDIAAIMELESAHLDEKHVTALLKVIENIRDSCSFDPSAMMIINEEAPGYFTGQKTVDDVVNIIQKRGNAIVQERG